jgi:hypothetical protein
MRKICSDNRDHLSIPNGNKNQFHSSKQAHEGGMMDCHPNCHPIIRDWVATDSIR